MNRIRKKVTKVLSMQAELLTEMAYLMEEVANHGTVLEDAKDAQAGAEANLKIAQATVVKLKRELKEATT